jgi:hypothetical protein
MKKIILAFTILASSFIVTATYADVSRIKSQNQSCFEPGTDFCYGCSVLCPAGQEAYCAPGVDDEHGDCDSIECGCREKASCFCE